MDESLMDPNEAPNGYAAVEDVGLGVCRRCAFQDSPRCHVDWQCVGSDRADKTNVRFESVGGLNKPLDDVCRAALAKWGRDSQEDVVIGELGELLALFGKRAQGRAKHVQWIDEIADCLIMLRQLAHIHGVDAVDELINVKLEALRRRIDGT